MSRLRIVDCGLGIANSAGQTPAGGRQDACATNKMPDVDLAIVIRHSCIFKKWRSCVRKLRRTALFPLVIDS
jgi:hypothetical protein